MPKYYPHEEIIKSVNTLINALLVKDISPPSSIKDFVSTYLCDLKFSKKVNLFNKSIKMVILH